MYAITKQNKCLQHLRSIDKENLMELTIEQALQQGTAAHKEGKLEDAERLYRAILQLQPSHPDANHNLGILAVSVNKNCSRSQSNNRTVLAELY
jgi:thioredoxin-like negative regulator of GroEL